MMSLRLHMFLIVKLILEESDETLKATLKCGIVLKHKIYIKQTIKKRTKFN